MQKETEELGYVLGEGHPLMFIVLDTHLSAVIPGNRGLSDGRTSIHDICNQANQMNLVTTGAHRAMLAH